ncbi:MAG: YeeE/YedE family protein [Phycisphaerales bacterium]|nr:YeeE/YedE family protein [Phycisphaerales bacterium]
MTSTLASAWIGSPSDLLMGALAGLVFGFLLQKGGVTKFSVIVDQLRLKDFTVMKVMMTAIVVGSIGIYGMQAVGVEFSMHIKGAAIAGVGLGGVIFGVGMALLGYCPGTAFAALGDGSRHALFGVLGMFVGAGVYAEVYPWFNAHVLPRWDLGKVTLASEAGVSPWIIILPLALVTAGIFFWMERARQARQPSA